MIMTKIVTSFLCLAIAVSISSGLSRRALAQQPTDLETLKSDYFFEFEQYDLAKDKFDFERAEFHTLGTLASQEDAISALKNLMIARAKTHSAYLGILDHLLIRTQAVDLAEKEKGLEEIREAQAYIKNHLDLVPNLFDKTKVLTESARFEEGMAVIVRAQYRSLTLLAISKVQSLLDQVIVSAHDFEEEVVNLIEDEDFRAANQRGMKEVGARLTEAEKNMEASLNDYRKFDDEKLIGRDKRGAVYAGTYDATIKSLQKVSPDLSQSVEFLIELERGI
jgi:hypothetical protein